MTANLPAKTAAPLPSPTPQIAKSLSQPALQEHRAKIAFEVRVALSAYFDPSESDEVKAGLLAWFCDELQDWKHEQVVWGLREWNRENPRRRPTPGDIVAILKRARGEKYAKQVASTKVAEPQPVITEEARQRNLEVVSQLFPSIVKRIPEVKE